MLNKSASLAEYVHPALMSVIYLVAAYGGVAVGGDPHSGEVVGVYLVVYELSETGLMHVDTSGLTVVDLAVNYGGIRAGFYFETGYSVVVDIVRFEITLEIFRFFIELVQKTLNEVNLHRSPMDLVDRGTLQSCARYMQSPLFRVGL